MVLCLYPLAVNVLTDVPFDNDIDDAGDNPVLRDITQYAAWGHD